MEKQVLYNSNMHFELQHWKRKIAFWEDELKVFNYRLSELVTRWTAKEVQTKLDRYQSEFIIHGGVVEDLLEVIEEHGIGIAEQIKRRQDSLDTQITKKHIELRDKMESERDVYAKLKKDFFRFLEKSL